MLPGHSNAVCCHRMAFSLGRGSTDLNAALRHDYRVAHRGLLLDARRAIDQSCEKIWRISETANAERFGLQDGESGEVPFDLAETVIRELGTTLIEAQVRAIRAMRPKVTRLTGRAKDGDS